jgi:hypothetical protein
MALDGFAPSVAADIFQRAAGLGGHLVVAFIAPVGASSPRSRFRSGVRPSVSEVEAAGKRALVSRLIEQATPRPTERPSAPGPRKPTSESATATQTQPSPSPTSNRT